MTGVSIRANEVTVHGDIAGGDISKTSETAWISDLIALLEDLEKEDVECHEIEKKTINLFRAVPDGIQVALAAVLQGPLAAIGVAIDKICDVAFTGG